MAMIVAQPPYALAPTSFRFPALAALAGRMPLGGERETVLATYLAARLAHDAFPERGLNEIVRAERSAAAKTWLGTLAVPATVKPTLLRLVEASSGRAEQIAEAVRGVIAVTAPVLDARSRSELERLAAAFEKS